MSDPLITQYDGFIIDLWGVVHDGSQLYDGAIKALAALHQLKKPVMFLSNAPRRSALAASRLTQLGVPDAHYRQVITSGEIAAQMLASGALDMGKKYYYLGPGKDENILHDLANFTRVEKPNQADFILNTGYEIDFQSHDDVLPILTTLQGLRLPLICVNPDLEVVKQDGTHMLCAGTLAKAYSALGGKVVYVGKPHRAVYDAAIKALQPAQKLLAIGDNPLTDILGANRMGIDSLLVTSGVLGHHHGQNMTDEKARELCAIDGANPTYIATDIATGLLA
jgi:HAD superfamily hydrolase (TIGR01459 family)